MSMNLYVVLENGEEVPESVNSEAFAWHSSDLEVMARGLGLRPLCDFEVDYEERLADIPSDEDIEENETERMMTVAGADDLWFDPNEALESARGLIQHIETLPEGGTNAVKLEVLRGLVNELEYAKQRQTRFHPSLYA